MNEFLDQYFLGNCIADYLWFAGILLLGLIFKRFISRVVSHVLFRLFKKRSGQAELQRFIVLMSRPLQFFFIVIVIYIACDRLTFPEQWNLDPDNVFGLRYILFQVFKGAIALGLTWILIRLAEYVGQVMVERAKQSESRTDDQLVPFLKEAIKVIIAGLGLLITMAVAFDLDIVSLITGLGIGGLAFALAAKETLENLLGSFTIFMDKPFVVGDQVKVGAFEGRVESIGFRSTRLRAPDRTLVIVPNKKMVDAELINETNRHERRARYIISLNSDATPQQVKSIFTQIREYLVSHREIEQDPIVHFHQFGSGSLDILINYYVLTMDYSKFMNVQDEINLKIIDIVRDNDCDFAAAPGVSVDKKLSTLNPGSN